MHPIGYDQRMKGLTKTHLIKDPRTIAIACKSLGSECYMALTT